MANPVATEEELRALLDARGILRDDAPLRDLDRNEGHTVFVQRADARLDIDALKSQAERFFATKLGLTVDKHYGPTSPAVDAARIVVASKDAAISGTRLCYGRPVTPEDLEAADDAERASGTYGLALLARRCKALWMIRSEPGIDPRADRCALTLAAIFASTLLGPIVTPGRRAIFGVRGARLALERAGKITD